MISHRFTKENMEAIRKEIADTKPVCDWMFALYNRNIEHYDRVLSDMAYYMIAKKLGPVASFNRVMSDYAK